MKSHTAYLWFETKARREFINIQDKVEAAVKKARVKEGFCFVGAMHTSAAIWVNDADDGLLQDIEEFLQQLVPFGKKYRHHHTGEDNGDAHLKSLLVHPQVILPITGGKLDLGPWQQVYYGEFDGKRKKRVVIKVIGE
ncbi:MAG: secondary thiamine-phosphate synthase enzyme YjbQ [Candidatus Diapherotrites archaeon]|uniref:Secondary thiamine-phosphate synthase enzyme YjbQ n=1 Tax=Candidatus Iainarchaeum sp. TaxID=3101447 RepID=A0A8T4L8N4_9ARCH|nr:secondary thiamine-phosphate synthase enzyme YjbQ [Candidatus Diapherotrites archaeon]